MPLAPVIATMPTATTHAALLTIDGLDVLADPAGRYAVLEDSIRVTMAGPGGVSTLTFTVDDPSKLVSVTPGQFVRFRNLASGELFAGWTETPVYTSAFGDQGRQINVTCIGVEALLDWLTTDRDITFTNDGPGVSMPGEWTSMQMITRVLANTSGAGILNAASGAGSSWANPVADETALINATTSTVPATIVTFTILAGTTLRNAIKQIDDVVLDGRTDLGIMFTVDTGFRLRWAATVLNRFFGQGPSGGYVPLPDTTLGPALARHAASVKYTIDGGSIVRTVVVKGTAGAGFPGGQITVSDGTGLRGQTATITDPAITTTSLAIRRGVTYLQLHAAGVRGDATLESYGDTVADHTLARLVLTDPTTPASGTWWLGSIELRAFSGPTYDAVFHFGGQAPSAAALLRSLTRGASA